MGTGLSLYPTSYFFTLRAQVFLPSFTLLAQVFLIFLPFFLFFLPSLLYGQRFFFLHLYPHPYKTRMFCTGRRLDRRSSVWGAKHGCFAWADDLTGGQVSGVVFVSSFSYHLTFGVDDHLGTQAWMPAKWMFTDFVCTSGWGGFLSFTLLAQVFLSPFIPPPLQNIHVL